MPISGFANRYNVFSAVCSFARYVISRNLVPPEIYNQLKTLRPRRYGQPRRTVLEPDQIHRFITAIWTTTGNTPTEKRTNFALVKTLIGTGLRSKELCELTVKDVDLNRRTLLVRCGKGGKQRLLGLSQELAKVLSQYAREVRPHTIVDRFFVTESGRAITPTTLSRRISGSSTVSGGIWGGDGGVTVG
jgi:site-specific recombinase XerD